MIFATIVVVLGPALILRGCRAGACRWPRPRSWFEIPR